jgi:hypothetical protein
MGLHRRFDRKTAGWIVKKRIRETAEFAAKGDFNWQNSKLPTPILVKISATNQGPSL